MNHKKIRVYELAKEALQIIQSNGDPASFCHAFSMAETSIEHNLALHSKIGLMIEYGYIYEGVKANLKLSQGGPYAELLEFRPIDPDMYWFDSRDFEMRINILDSILKTLYNEKESV